MSMLIPLIVPLVAITDIPKIIVAVIASFVIMGLIGFGLLKLLPAFGRGPKAFFGVVGLTIAAVALASLWPLLPSIGPTAQDEFKKQPVPQIDVGGQGKKDAGNGN